MQLQLVTDQGNKYTKLNFEELKHLHYTLQNVQDHMDQLLQ